MPPDDVILARIRKLLAVAEHPGTPPAEAESAAAAAERLMIKHAIDDALVSARGEVRSKPEVRNVVIDAPYASAKTVLIGTIASVNGVRSVEHRGAKPAKVSLVGFDSDLRLVDLLYTSLLLQAATALRRQPETGRAFRRAFLIGFAAEVGERLREARADAVEESGGASTDLVLRDRARDVEDAMYEAFPRITRAGRLSISDRTGLIAGRRSGATANLGTDTNQLDGRRTAIGG
jgi:hypothetical protein